MPPLENKNLSKLPEDIKAKIAKRSRDKGSNYERDVAKKIADYFGWQWSQAFFRTKPHGMAQPNGDIQPINEMNDLWRAAKLGPLECKSRKEWSFNNLFKDVENSYLMGYWYKSNDDTRRNNTVLIFTKPAMTDFVLHVEDGCFLGPVVRFTIKSGQELIIQTLKNFLKSHWSK